MLLPENQMAVNRGNEVMTLGRLNQTASLLIKLISTHV